MGKRKRENIEESAPTSSGKSRKQSTAKQGPLTVQIITGSYERALHGIVATIPEQVLQDSTLPVPNANSPTTNQPASAQSSAIDDSSLGVKFADTFLFNAHLSAIRCLALSPPSDSEGASRKRTLATGSTDERINLYTLSTAPPPVSKGPPVPNLAGMTISQNPKNKELGSLNQHSASITKLHFPSHSKLMSASEDNTIAIARTRDWEVLSTVKAPMPNPVGRPSGDTAGPGEIPAGINDFAVHPSMKLMVSVGRGERCMRLWNLVTGKRAGVLNFDKSILQAVGEGKYSTGEGRKIEWDEEGEEFVIAFERRAIVFNMDSKPKGLIIPSPRTKIHRISYLPSPVDSPILAVSTEDGRILFFSTSTLGGSGSSNMATCKLIAQLGGRAAGVSGRIKDFEMLGIPSEGDGSPKTLIVTTGSSDGAVRVWVVHRDELESPQSIQKSASAKAQSDVPTRQVGKLVATHETGNRITCLTAFIMTGDPEVIEDEEMKDPADGESSSNDDSD